MARPTSATLAVALLVLAPGCGDERPEASRAGSGHPDPGDTSVAQGVEIVDGRFVPPLVSVGPAQPINFTNRDDEVHRIIKLSGPGQYFRSGLLAPGERYRTSLVGREGWQLRSGTVIYRSNGPGRPRGRIEVYGTAIPRLDEAESPRFTPEPPVEPDRAARQRARWLAAYVRQCADPRPCDTPAELVNNVGGGHALRFVPGSSATMVESDVSAAGPEIPLGRGPDEVEVLATRNGFVVVAHSRTSRDFRVRGAP